MDIIYFGSLDLKVLFINILAFKNDILHELFIPLFVNLIGSLKMKEYENNKRICPGRKS